jgi:spermidine/putrescine transport system permease protein
MAAPLFLVILFSFNESALTSLPLTGFTFDWYRKLFANSSFWPALENSLIVGFTVALASVATGTLAALALARMDRRRAALLLNLLSIPMMLPALILGIALICYFVRLLDLRLGLGTVILGHLVIAQPFVVLIVYARLATFDWSALDSARDLGASPLTAFRTIMLPIIQPTIIGAALIALSISLDDFVITFFTIGSGNTLPTLVWGLVRTSLDPTINAMATLLILLSIGSTIIALRLTSYRG